MIFLGIDPGLNGGLAFINENGIMNAVFKMPVIAAKDYDIQELKNMLIQWGPDFALIEQQIALPGQGLSSTLQTGKGFGILLGLLAGLNIPHQVINARVWQSRLFTGVKSSLDTKAKSEIIAKRLFPTTGFRKSDRATKADDGLTDAACIAEMGRLIRLNQAAKLFNTPIIDHTPMPGNEAVCLKCGRIIESSPEGCQYDV